MTCPPSHGELAVEQGPGSHTCCGVTWVGPASGPHGFGEVQNASESRFPRLYMGVITASSQEPRGGPGIKLGSVPGSSGICGCCWLTLSAQALPAGAGNLRLAAMLLFCF